MARGGVLPLLYDSSSTDMLAGSSDRPGMSMTLRSGTSGFSYKQWKGAFYPEKLPAGKPGAKRLGAKPMRKVVASREDDAQSA